MHAKLRVIGGKANKKEILLKLPSVVGRSREAGLTIAHPMISRQHCEIFESGGLVRIRDLGSTNGTYVAGKKVAESILHPRDQFSVGPLTFEVDYEYVGDSTVAEEAAAASLPDFAPASGPEAAEEADEKVFQFLADEEPPLAEPPAAAAPEPAESPAESPAGGLDFLGAPAEPGAEPAPEPEVSGPPAAEGEFAPPGEEPEPWSERPEEEEPEPWSEPPEEVGLAPEPEAAPVESSPAPPDRGLEATEFFHQSPLPRAEEGEAGPLPAWEPPGDVPDLDFEPAPPAPEPQIAPPPGAMPGIAPAAESPAPPGIMPSIAPPDGQLPDFSAWGAAATADPSQTVDAPPDFAPGAGFDQGGEPAAEYPFANAEETTPAEPGDVPAPTSPQKPKKGGWWRLGKGKTTARGSKGRSSSPYPSGLEGFDGGAGAGPAAAWQEESAPTLGSPTPPFPTPPPPSPPPVPPAENPGQAASGEDTDLDEFFKGLQ